MFKLVSVLLANGFYFFIRVLIIQTINQILESSDAAHNPDGESVTSAVTSHTCASVETQKPHRKTRKIQSSSKCRIHDRYSQTEVTMMIQASQTDMPHTSNSPQKIKSISLADLHNAVSNDHIYASSKD